MPQPTTSAKLLITVFTCGFVVMAFEIIGSRVLAPYVGTSTFVWVSIIGVILMAMSAGYYYGGLRADRSPSLKEIARFVMLAAAAIALMNLGKEHVLRLMIKIPMPLILTSTFSALLLFSIPAFCLAAVFPYALKLGLIGHEDTGKVAGKFYAISTLGSILGTFLSAILMIPLLGTTNILWILAALLLLVAILAFNDKANQKLSLVTITLVFLSALNANSDPGFMDIDTAYNRVWIYDNHLGDRHTRHMALNGHVNSGMFIDDPVVDQVYPYSSYFQLAEHFNTGFDHALMLGAGAYSFPKLFQHLWPQRTLDVVEIDDELTALSTEHFAFSPSKKTTLHHEDARMFLNYSSQQFDVIFSDVFTSPREVPFHMTTVECYQAIHNRLTPDGVLIANVLGAIDGEHSAFLKSQIKTVKQVFPQVLLFEVAGSSSGSSSNNMLIALKSTARPMLNSENPLIQEMLDNERFPVINENTPILTDDFAPANWLLSN